MNYYRNIFKPSFDFLFAILLLIIFSPLFLIVCSILFFNNNKKIFFTQPRPGKNEKIFKIFKFKTMNDRSDTDGRLLPDEDRITKFGKFLRKTSLDEIPQLFNVIKGDISIIGPRPLLVEYLKLYSNEQRKRHTIKPGITGWAQVNGRNELSWQKKFEHDIYYVDNISLSLDIKILILTIKKVLKSEGISKKDHATTEKFYGN